MSPAKRKQKANPNAVKVVPGLIAARPGQRLTRYWIGVVWACPIQNLSAGGQTFQKFRGNPNLHSVDNSLKAIEQAYRELPRGSFVMLTDEQVELVRHGVAMRVLRLRTVVNEMATTGDGVEDVPEFETPQARAKTAHVVMVDGPHYRPQPNDVPMAKFVWMLKTEGMLVDDMNQGEPEPMFADGDVPDFPLDVEEEEEEEEEEVEEPAAAGTE